MTLIPAVSSFDRDKLAVCFVVDLNFLAIGIAQAAEVARNEPGVEVHLFVEADAVPAWADPPAGVILHHNALLHRLPPNLPTIGKWPLIVYGRLFFADVLPHRRILYLDADVARVGPLAPLINLDLGDHSLAAVHDVGLIGERAPGFNIANEQWLPNIGLARRRYFNAGVILFNADKWRGRDILSDLPAYFEKFGAHTRMQDQDFLNYTFQNDWLELSPIWNFQLPLMGYGFERAFAPALIHFTDAVKPWHWNSFGDDAAQAYYRRILSGAGLSADLVPQKRRKQRALDAAKRGFWRLAHDAGFGGGKIGNRRKRWIKAEAAFRDYYAQRLAESSFADQPKTTLPAAPIPAFDGVRFKAAVEIRYP